MANWDRIVKSHHKRAHQRDGFTLAMRRGVNGADVAVLEQRLGFEFPAEFRELYSTFNGVGVCSGDSSANVYWFTRPLEELPEFIDRTRNWFIETHAEVAARFFPFVDWGNGDGLGYLASPTGLVLPGLYCFGHESYKFNVHQDADEFLTHAPISLEEFFNSV